MAEWLALIRAAGKRTAGSPAERIGGARKRLLRGRPDGVDVSAPKCDICRARASQMFAPPFPSRGRF